MISIQILIHSWSDRVTKYIFVTVIVRFPLTNLCCLSFLNKYLSLTQNGVWSSRFAFKRCSLCGVVCVTRFCSCRFWSAFMRCCLNLRSLLFGPLFLLKFPICVQALFSLRSCLRYPFPFMSLSIGIHALLFARFTISPCSCLFPSHLKTSFARLLCFKFFS